MSDDSTADETRTDRPHSRADLQRTQNDDATIYRVLVDVALELDFGLITRLFRGGLVEQVEEIGENQYQIAVAARGPNEGEAYRRAVNYVESVVECAQLHTEGGVIGATVYGEDTEVTFD